VPGAKRPELYSTRPLPGRGRPTVYVHPGQVFATPEPFVVSTVLGSCIAVCLWDRTSQVGGMNHYLLPEPTRRAPSGPRFGPEAMTELLAAMCRLGSEPSRLEAKVFGGTCRMGEGGAAGTLGHRNYLVAQSFLEHARIPIVAEDVGGERGRRLWFYVEDGSVWVNTL
jgi:chemotaxis protein CheD